MTTFVVVGGSVSPERASDYVRSAAVSLNRISSASIADTSAALTVATSNPSTLTASSGDTNNGAIRTTTTTPTTTTTNTPTGNVLTEITVENGVNEGNAQNQNNNVDEGQCGQNDDKDGPGGEGQWPNSATQSGQSFFGTQGAEQRTQTCVANPIVG